MGKLKKICHYESYKENRPLIEENEVGILSKLAGWENPKQMKRYQLMKRRRQSRLSISLPFYYDAERLSPILQKKLVDLGSIFIENFVSDEVSYIQFAVR